MKFKITCFIIFSVFFSCVSTRAERRCNEHIEGLQSLNLNSFKEFCEYVEIGKDGIDNILWIIDGDPVSNDTIASEIDNKIYDILKVDIINKDKLTGLYLNKNWELAVVVTTNACIK